MREAESVGLPVVFDFLIPFIFRLNLPQILWISGFPVCLRETGFISRFYNNSVNIFTIIIDISNISLKLILAQRSSPMGFRTIFAFLPVLLTAFGPMEGPPLGEENHYNLRFLHDSRPPVEMKLVRYDIARQRQVVERGIILSYKSRTAHRVLLAGDFSNWKPLAMERGQNGVWYYFVTATGPGGHLRYKFIVDGVWVHDPRNPVNDDDGMGSYVSILPPLDASEGVQLSYRALGDRTVEFRLHRPKARTICLIGDFNNWNPENDPLSRGRDGVWRLRKKLYRGSFRYCYVIDGEWTVDVYNSETASSDTGQVCSLIRIE